MATKPVSILPVEAEDAGCSATCESYSTYVVEGRYRISTYTNYQLSASVEGAPGWTFSHFVFTGARRDGTPYTIQTSSGINPFPTVQSTTYTDPCECEALPLPGAPVEAEYQTIDSVTAYFIQDSPNYTVTTEAKYAAGGTVTGGGTYATGTTITLEATANPGYQFAGWKSSAGDTESSPSFSYTVNSNITWTAYFGTRRLIYFDRTGAGIDVPGDATVTIDFDPKVWTCEEYGYDHKVTMDVAPSWGSITSIDKQETFSLPHSTIAGGSTFTIGLTAFTYCDAGVYPTITAMVVIQQLNVGTFTLEVPLTVGTQSTAAITASGGRITALN